MQEINVFITKPGESGIQVDPPIVGVHSGDAILWSLHSVLRGVKWVQVEFQGKNGKAAKAAKFFEVRGGDPVSQCHTKLNGGHGHLIGTAPLLNLRPGTKGDKYWIKAYRNDPSKPGQEPVAWLDPDIITCDP